MLEQKVNLLSESTLLRTQAIARDFKNASPFRHAVIDNFFEHNFAIRLLEEFPSLAVRPANGADLAARTEPFTHLGSSFELANKFFCGPPFLHWISEITGITGLVYDAEMYDGGIREDHEGQESLPRVDLNYHPATGHHRRLTLVVFLNADWREEWGGSLQFHSDPSTPQLDETRSYLPIFNRCVIFESSEYSWHAFRQISFPAPRKTLSGKSFSIHLYTKERPTEARVAPRDEVYVAPPLPSHFAAGYVLKEHDVKLLRHLLQTRDGIIGYHQQRKAANDEGAAKLASYAASVHESLSGLRLPLLGYVKQVGPIIGLYPDGWTDGELKFAIHTSRATKTLTMRGLAHPDLQSPLIVQVFVQDHEFISSAYEPGARLEFTMPLRIGAGAAVAFTIRASATANPERLGVGEDRRDLSLHLDDLTFEHLPLS